MRALLFLLSLAVSVSSYAIPYARCQGTTLKAEGGYSLDYESNEKCQAAASQFFRKGYTCSGITLVGKGYFIDFHSAELCNRAVESSVNGFFCANTTFMGNGYSLEKGTPENCLKALSGPQS